MAGRLTFPTQPRAVSYFNEPSGEPSVQNRWQQYNYNQARRSMRWHGQCVGCNRATYADADGTICESLYNNALMVMPVNIGTSDKPDWLDVRCCWYCSQNDSRMSIVRSNAIAAIERGDTTRENAPSHFGPLAWPTEEERKAKIEKEREAQANALNPLAV